MVCGECETEQWKPAPLRQPVGPSRLPACDRCGAVILMLEGVVVGPGEDTLAQLSRFGLAITGPPLLEPRRGDG